MLYFESKHIYASSQNSKIHQIFSNDLNFIFKNDLEGDIEEGMLLRWHSGKGFTCQCRKQETWVRSLGQKVSCSRKWHPTPASLPGKFHGTGVWWAIVPGVAKSWTQLNMHALKKEQIWISWNEVDELRDCYTEWSKGEREK